MFGHKEAILWFIECNLKIQLRYNLQSEVTCKVCADKHSTSYPGLKLKKKDSRSPRQDRSKNKSNESLQKQIFKINVTAYEESIACASTSIKCHHQYLCGTVIIKHMDSPKEIVTHTTLDSCSQGVFVVEDLIEVSGIKGIETSVVVKTRD